MKDYLNREGFPDDLFLTGSYLCVSKGSNGLGQPLCAVLRSFFDHG